MIPLDKLRSVKHLVTHANCPDGVASALIIKDALPDVRVSFVKYGAEHRNLPVEPGTLFCDFSPYVVRSKQADGVERLDGNAMARWVEAGTIVLDHHTRDIVDNFALNGLGVFGENERLECGAMLAFKHVWLPLHDFKSSNEADHIFNFAERAAVRDTWRQDDGRFKRAREEGELLLFWGMKQPLEYYLGLSDEGRGMLAGRLFERAEEHARTAIAESVRFTTGKGTRVLFFQGVAATSDAAEILEKDANGRYSVNADLVVGFHYRVDAGRLQLQFSTRSHTGFDCQALARAHGGNGHRAAAGFTVENAGGGLNPYEMFSDLLNEWERGR